MLASRRHGFAVVLQAAQKGEVNKQTEGAEPAATCDGRCHWLSVSRDHLLLQLMCSAGNCSTRTELPPRLRVLNRAPAEA